MNYTDNFQQDEDIPDFIIEYFEKQVELLKCDIEIAQINKEIEAIKNECT